MFKCMNGQAPSYPCDKESIVTYIYCNLYIFY